MATFSAAATVSAENLTGDIPAARMSTNIRTAISDAGGVRNAEVAAAAAIDESKVNGAFVPSGLVAYLNDAITIPTGWVEETRARGRYIVGLVLSGTDAATAGTALTNTESRTAGLHTHTVTVTDAGHTHVMVTDDGAIGAAGSIATTTQTTSQTNVNTNSNTTGITASADSGPSGGVAGTPAPYIQLRAIRKS